MSFLAVLTIPNSRLCVDVLANNFQFQLHISSGWCSTLTRPPSSTSTTTPGGSFFSLKSKPKHRFLSICWQNSYLQCLTAKSWLEEHWIGKFSCKTDEKSVLLSVMESLVLCFVCDNTATVVRSSAEGGGHKYSVAGYITVYEYYAYGRTKVKYKRTE